LIHYSFFLYYTYHPYTYNPYIILFIIIMTNIKITFNEDFLKILDKYNFYETYCKYHIVNESLCYYDDDHIGLWLLGYYSLCDRFNTDDYDSNKYRRYYFIYDYITKKFFVIYNEKKFNLFIKQGDLKWYEYELNTTYNTKIIDDILLNKCNELFYNKVVLYHNQFIPNFKFRDYEFNNYFHQINDSDFNNFIIDYDKRNNIISYY